MKDILKKFVILGMIVFGAGFLNTGVVFADSTVGSCDTSFLGLNSWDCGVNLDEIQSTDGLKSGIWTIVANIATDATLLAAYLALGFVIYGGYLYIFSYGDAGKVATGKKTLTMAFIGFGIVILANVIFNGIKFALIKTGVGSSGSYGLPDAEAGVIFANAVSWVIGVAGFAAAIFLVYGGISYITASGDAGKLTKAKNAIIYSLIGLAIVGLSEVILGFVSSNIRNAANSYIINTQEIALVEEKYEKNS